MALYPTAEDGIFLNSIPVSFSGGCACVFFCAHTPILVSKKLGFA